MSVPHTPTCAILDACGACDRMSLSYEDQLRLKVQETQSRLRHDITATHPSPQQVGYRARVRMRFNAHGELGYHAVGTHQHIAASSCAIAAAPIRRVLPLLSGGPEGCTVEIRTDGSRVQLDAQAPRGPKRKPLRQWLGALDLEQAGIAGISINGKRLRGRTHLEFDVCDIHHRLSPGTFYQVNLELNRALVARVVDWTKMQEPARVLDLYSGAGNLSLPLAADGIPVTMVESSKSAIGDAKECIRRMGLDVQVHVGDAGRFKGGDHFFDIAILDPPRAGAPGVVDQLLVTRPRAFAYVSCNPRSLTRDLAPALRSGYQLAGLELFDMFPQTSHSEVLALLTRV